jgi:hypothetical protein
MIQVPVEQEATDEESSLDSRLSLDGKIAFRASWSKGAIQNARESRPVSLIPEWVIAEPSVKFREILWQVFFEEPNVQIFSGSLNFKGNDFDAILLSGNCFGFKEQSLMAEQIEK